MRSPPCGFWCVLTSLGRRLKRSQLGKNGDAILPQSLCRRHFANSELLLIVAIGTVSTHRITLHLFRMRTALDDGFQIAEFYLLRFDGEFDPSRTFFFRCLSLGKCLSFRKRTSAFGSPCDCASVTVARHRG